MESTKPRLLPSAVVFVVSVIVIATTIWLSAVLGGNSSAGAQVPAPTPSPTASATEDPQLAQCRVDAVVAYMQAQGFEDGDYVIGEENIDPNAPELLESGAIAFGEDGANVTSRSDLQEVFSSTAGPQLKVVSAQVAKFPSLDEDVIRDVNNWEIVQTTVAAEIQGNTGLTGGENVVSLGTRKSAAGDAVWLFIDPTTCTVVVAEVQPATAQPGDPPAVGLIRVGCINPGDNLWPKDWSKSPSNGWTPLPAGTETDGKVSEDQKESGQTSGNVIDNPVPSGTQSGDVTPDLPTGTVTAPGGTSGGDSSTGVPRDTDNTNDDTGGTNGDTDIGGPPPD